MTLPSDPGVRYVRGMSHARRLKYLPLADLGRAPRNPNGHDLPALRSSIRRHGFVEPVILDERTGFLLGGHGRLDTLVEMEAAGESPPPGVHATKAGWTVPVVLGYSSENDAEAEALVLAMIALPRAGDVHQQLLAEMLGDLASTDLGLDGTGYSADDLDDLLASIGEADPPETEEGFTEDRDSGAFKENTYEDWADNYRNKQVRSMVFDFPLDDYATVAELAGRARPAYGVASNAELFQRMLEAWAAANPA